MLNWSVRYNKIICDNPELFDPSKSVVEVGSGPLGIAQFLQRQVIGIEPDPPVSQSEFLVLQQGSVLQLPFRNDAVDFVLCMDLLERIPSELRAQAVRELVRVARRKVIISSPCHRWADGAERDLQNLFQRLNCDVPGWLQEHIAAGIPSIGDMLRPIVQTGLRFWVEGNETILQHYSGIVLDWLFPEMDCYNQKIKEKSPPASPVYGSVWDFYYSFVFSISKSHASLPPASPGRLPNPGGARDTILENRAGLYAVYHKDFALTHLDAIKPIFSGTLAAQAAPGQLTDRLADGTSLTNGRWSEMSAIYRIWREGPRTSIVGFTHYRRQFDFRGFAEGGAAAERSRETTLAPEEIAEYSQYFHCEEAIRAVERGAIIVAMPHDTVDTIFDHYCIYHSTRDYLDILNKASSGSLLGGFLKQFESRSLFANNMFIAKWHVFAELCVFWFDYLAAFESENPQRNASPYQRRDIAFLAERIFDAWVRSKKDRGVQVIEQPIFFLE